MLVCIDGMCCFGDFSPQSSQEWIASSRKIKMEPFQLHIAIGSDVTEGIARYFTPPGVFKRVPQACIHNSSLRTGSLGEKCVLQMFAILYGRLSRDLAHKHVTIFRL